MRYKRYFPVSHGINRDPEILTLVERFGAKGLMFWLEVLSILDQKENVVDLSPSGIELIRRWIGIHSRSNANSIANQFISNGWLVPIQPESNGLFESPNYWEYHRNRAPKGDKLAQDSSRIGVPPSLPFPSPSSDLKKDPQKNTDLAISENGYGFEAFWFAYPKKKKKGDAEKAWKGLKPTHDLQDVIAQAIERGKASNDWQKDNGQFIPYPATWLRAKGWEDEYTTGGQRLYSGEELIAWAEEQERQQGKGL